MAYQRNSSSKEVRDVQTACPIQQAGWMFVLEGDADVGEHNAYTNNLETGQVPQANILYSVLAPHFPFFQKKWGTHSLL